MDAEFYEMFFCTYMASSLWPIIDLFSTVKLTLYLLDKATSLFMPYPFKIYISRFDSLILHLEDSLIICAVAQGKQFLDR
jgi:hypothetical protein